MKSSRIRLGRSAMALVLAALVVAPAHKIAADARDRLFAPGALASLPAGAALAFSRDRAVPESGGVKPIEDGALTISITGEDGGPTEARVRFDRAERAVVVPPSPTTAAHPALLVFLETTVNSIAKLTGGSPHYIKNRFIEAFAEPDSVEPVQIEFADGAVSAEKMVFRPFAGDPHTDQLGQLADLELMFIMSGVVPGGLHTASATGGAYRHVLTLEDVEEGR